MAVMFFNLKNAIEQYTGVFPAMLKATPVQMLSSLQNYIADRQGTMARQLQTFHHLWQIVNLIRYLTYKID